MLKSIVTLRSQDILIFWLDKGVDGFSIDSASFLLEDEEFKDEPLLGSSIESYNDLDHIYTQNQKETYDLIYQFRELLDDYNKYHSGDARILLTEALGSIDKITLFYGSEDGSELGAQSTFNYQLVENVHSESNAKDVVDAINIWLDYKPVQYTSNWMVSYKHASFHSFMPTSLAWRSQSPPCCDTSWQSKCGWLQHCNGFISRYADNILRRRDRNGRWGSYFPRG